MSVFSEKVKEYAALRGIDISEGLRLRDFNTWASNVTRVETAVSESMIDSLGVNGPGGPARSVRSDITKRANDWLISPAPSGRALLGMARRRSPSEPGWDASVNKSETVFAVAGESKPKPEPNFDANAPKSSKMVFTVSFARQPAAPAVTMESLIATWIAERGLEDTPDNRTKAREYFARLAERRGMIELNPALLRMNDLNWLNYQRALALAF